MSDKIKRVGYGGIALLILGVEWMIEGTSGFVRNTVGDLLVVLLIYAAVRVIFPNRPRPLWLAIGVLVFAVFVELTQYFDLIGALGLGGERAAHLTMGATFDWGDIAAYTVGCAIAFGVDTLFVGEFNLVGDVKNEFYMKKFCENS